MISPQFLDLFKESRTTEKICLNYDSFIILKTLFEVALNHLFKVAPVDMKYGINATHTLFIVGIVFNSV